MLACSGTAQCMWCHAGNVCNKGKVMNGDGHNEVLAVMTVLVSSCVCVSSHFQYL